jgi:membrane fusion protein, multidrug efflux system
VQRNSSSTYVYVVKPDSTVTLRQVKIGTSDDNNTEITSGVQEGDVVVLTGVDKLQEGTKVTAHLEGAANTGKQPAAKQPAKKQSTSKQPTGKPTK